MSLIADTFKVGQLIQQQHSIHNDKVYQVESILDDWVIVKGFNEAAKQWMQYLRCANTMVFHNPLKELKEASLVQLELPNCKLPEVANVCGSL